MKKKILLKIMGLKGLKVLELTIQKHRKMLAGVVSARDLNVQNDYFDDIKEICIQNNIPFFSKNEKEVPAHDYIIAVAWRKMIVAKPDQLIIFHDSLLPKYRGFNPLVSCLLNKEKQIGVSALFGFKDYDTGDIIDQVSTPIKYPIKINYAILLVSDLYVKLVDKVLNTLNAGHTLLAKKQLESDASYSLWRDEKDYNIDWTLDADYLSRFIDSVGYPYQGARTSFDDIVLRILDAELVKDLKIENRTPGKVIFLKENCPVVVCGRGLLKLTNVIYEATGKKVEKFNKFRMRLK